LSAQKRGCDWRASECAPDRSNAENTLFPIVSSRIALSRCHSRGTSRRTPAPPTPRETPCWPRCTRGHGKCVAVARRGSIPSERVRDMRPLRVRDRIVEGALLLLAPLLFLGADSTGCGGDVATTGDVATSGADGGNCTLQPSVYDRSCQVDSDCVAVSLGNVCSDVCAGVCPNAAIRSSESARYDADLAKAAARPTRGVACSCALGPAVCRTGKCAVLSPGGDLGGIDATAGTDAGGIDGGP
jgi:hypothetical protein